ncbi:MAG: aminotransferase class IV [Flavobacteriales bacterium]|nr:aminotransferase class IV [Flavobacteriales bacterium]
MSGVQLFNGEFFPADEALIHALNRGFSYGDGFFESIRVVNGKSAFIQLHWKRLEHACKVLRIAIPEELTFRTFSNQVNLLAQKNGHANARVRFQGFRHGAGRYAPDQSVLGWSAICQPLDSDQYQLNKVGLTVGLCNSCHINPLPQSSFKSTNSIPYILASIEAKENRWDDCFLTDGDGFLAEATGSNIFILKNNRLITPDLSNGGVAGVMRNVVLSTAQDIGIDTSTGLLKFEDVLEAEECFLTNATRGIQWVGAAGKKRFFKRVSSALTNAINQQLSRA